MHNSGSTIASPYQEVQPFGIMAILLESWQVGVEGDTPDVVDEGKVIYRSHILLNS